MILHFIGKSSNFDADAHCNWQYKNQTQIKIKKIQPEISKQSI